MFTCCFFRHALADYEKRMTATALEVEDWKAKAMDLERDKMELVRERDQAQEDLHNVEAAFSDLHRYNNCFNYVY